MFVGAEEQPRAIANLTSAQCRLPGLRLSTVTAFNQRLAAVGKRGWDVHPVPGDGCKADASCLREVYQARLKELVGS